MIERTAHAKINLALHVTGQREDGYHLLDSLVVFTSIGDAIRIENSRKHGAPIELSTDGPFSHSVPQDDDNLVKKAASHLYAVELKSLRKPDPVSITLTKNLPVASGIGGGSADEQQPHFLALRNYGTVRSIWPRLRTASVQTLQCAYIRCHCGRGASETMSPPCLWLNR